MAKKVVKAFLAIKRYFGAVLRCLGPLFVAKVKARNLSLNDPKVKLLFGNDPNLAISGVWNNACSIRIEEMWSFQRVAKNFAIFLGYFSAIIRQAP